MAAVTRREQAFPVRRRWNPGKDLGDTGGACRLVRRVWCVGRSSSEQYLCSHNRADNAQLVITHYQRLLNYIVPDFVHVLVDGRIERTGDKALALELEAKGYDWITKGEALPV